MHIIFIPGLLCTNSVWGDLNSIRNKYTSHDADVTRFCTIDEMATAIANHLPSDNLAVIGISMGGYVAIDLSLKVIGKIKKLILINTTANPVNEETLYERETSIKLAEQGKLSKVLEMSAGASYFKPKDEWIALDNEMANEIGAQAYIRQQRAIISRKNYTNLIKDIKADTLIISGKCDKVIPYIDSIYMFEQIANASLILLNECGHIATIEKSDIVANYIIKFLES